MPRALSPVAAFAGVAAVFAAFFVAAGAPTPLLGLLQQEWGFSSGTLTLAFAAYPFALLVAVLVGGSLSDHLGRRPVLLGALVVELAAMVLFLVAPDITWVVVARVVQGAATGLGTSAFSAAVVEHAPAHLKKLSATVVSSAVAAGLAVGALLTGVVIRFSSHATELTFGALAVVMVAGIVVVALAGETAVRRPGAWRSLAPRIVLPPALRTEFLAGIPAYAPGWMLGAFFLGLSPVVLRVRFGIDDGLVHGFTAFLGPAAAAIATLLFARVGARHTALAGAAMALTGAVLVLAGVEGQWLSVLWLGEIVGGAGFGAGFGGHLRLIGPLVEPQERAGLFAGIYTAAYLALGIPAVLAGQLVARVGLLTTVEGYAAVVVAIAAVGMGAQLWLLRRGQICLQQKSLAALPRPATLEA